MNECYYERYLCPYKCHTLQDCTAAGSDSAPKGFLKSEMEEHLKECPLLEQKCEKCQLTFTKSSIADHNCLVSLRLTLNSQKQKLASIHK